MRHQTQLFMQISKLFEKYNQDFITESIEWSNKDASLHELAPQILNFYKYWYMFEYEELYKPILFWKYGVVIEAFVRKFKKYFNLGKKDLKRQTENFIRIIFRKSR